MDLSLDQRYLDFRAEIKRFIADHKNDAPPAISIRDRGAPPPYVMAWQKELIANGYVARNMAALAHLSTSWKT